MIKKIKWFHVESKSFMDYDKRNFKQKVWYWSKYPFVLISFLKLMRGYEV